MKFEVYNVRRMSLSLLFSSILVLALCTRAWGQGGPPLIGDDPGTPGNGHWEINIAYIDLRTPRQNTMEMPQLDLNYGLGDHLQLNYQGSFLLGKEDGQSWMTGIDNSLFGVKWRFLDEDKNGVDMSTFPQVTINTSRSLGRAALVNTGSGVYWPVEIAKTFGKWELDGEAGYQFNGVGSNQYIGGVIVGYKLTEKIELLGESRATVDDAFHRTDVIFDGGAKIALNDNLAFLLAAGRSVRTDDQSISLYAYVGCQVTF